MDCEDASTQYFVDSSKELSWHFVRLTFYYSTEKQELSSLTMDVVVDIALEEDLAIVVVRDIVSVQYVDVVDKVADSVSELEDIYHVLEDGMVVVSQDTEVADTAVGQEIASHLVVLAGIAGRLDMAAASAAWAIYGLGLERSDAEGSLRVMAFFACCKSEAVLGVDQHPEAGKGRDAEAEQRLHVQHVVVKAVVYSC